jgi:hypothetical protein
MIKRYLTVALWLLIGGNLKCQDNDSMFDGLSISQVMIRCKPTETASYEESCGKALDKAFARSQEKDRCEVVDNAYLLHPDQLEALIKRGFDVHTRNKYGHTLLHAAYQKGASVEAGLLSLQCAKLLVSAGANVKARAKDGSTPLHLNLSNVDVVKFLIASGADVNAVDRDGFQPLDYAYSRYPNRSEITQFLIAADAQEGWGGLIARKLNLSHYASRY